MTNIILPVVGDVEQVKDFIKKTKLMDVTYYIGIESKNKSLFRSNKQTKVFVYEDGSTKEGMINSLTSKVDSGKIIIMRKLIEKDELASFITSNADITICEEKKRNKFANFFVKLWEKIVSLIFGINLFDGDTSVIGFCESMSEVLKNLPNSSYLTRVDRWKGASVEKIKTSSPPAKKEYDVVKNNLMFFGWLSLFLAIVAGATVYFVLEKATFLLGFVWASLILVSLVLASISTMIYILNIKTGRRKFDVAKEEEKK